MISDVLQILTDELNSFIGRKEPRYRGEYVVLLSDLVNQQGELVITIEDQSPRDNVIITLINVEEETVGKAQLPYSRNSNGYMELTNPAIKLNLYILFSTFSSMSSEQRYANCLNLLSYVIRFFQFKCVFNIQNTPSLNPNIEKLVVELISPTFEQQNYLWSALGAKYMPSVLYKVRMITVQEIEETVPGKPIEQVQRNVT